MVALWFPKEELKADLEDQAKKRLEEIAREAEKRRNQITEAAQKKLDDERLQAAMDRFNQMVDPLIAKGREAIDGASRVTEDVGARARQLVEEAQSAVQNAPTLDAFQNISPTPGLDGTGLPEAPQAPTTPPSPPPGLSGQPSTPAPEVPEVPQVPAAAPPMDGVASMSQSMFAPPGLGLGGLGGLSPRPVPPPPGMPGMPAPPSFPGLPQPPDEPPGFKPPGLPDTTGLGTALAGRIRGGMDAAGEGIGGLASGIGTQVDQRRDQAMDLAQQSLRVAQQALADKGAALAGPRDFLQEQHRIGTAAREADLASGANNVVGGQTTDLARTLMGLRRTQGWDEAQDRVQRQREELRAAAANGDTEEYARLQAELRADTAAEGGVLPAIARRAGATLGLGYLGAAGIDTNAPGSEFAFKEERPVFEDGRYTGRNELVEAPTGAARLWRDVPEQLGTVAGRGRRNETGAERAQALFGLATQPFNATGEVLHGAVGEISDDEAAAAAARLAGDVLGPGGALTGYGRAAGVAGDLAKAGLNPATGRFAWEGVKQAAKDTGWIRMLHAGAIGAGLAAAPVAAKVAYESARAGGMNETEALATAIDVGSASMQMGDLSDTAMGLGRGAYRGVEALQGGLPRLAERGLEAARGVPGFLGRMGEELTPEYQRAGITPTRGRGAAAPVGPAAELVPPSLGGRQSPEFTETMTRKVGPDRPDLDARLQDFFSQPRTDAEYRGILNELMANGTTAEKDLLKEYNKAGPPKKSDQAPMPQAFDPQWNPRLRVEVQPNGDRVLTLPSGTRRVEDANGKVLLAEKRTAPDHETFLRGMLDDYAEIRDPNTGERPADFYPVFGGYMSREVSEGKSPEAAAGARHQMFGGWGATTAMTAPPHNLRKTLHINALVNEFIHKREELKLPPRLPTGDEVQVMLRTGKMYFIPKDPTNPARTLDNELPLVEEVPKGGKAQRTIQADLAPVWASGDLEGDIPNLPPGYRIEEVRANKRAGGRVTEDTEVKGFAVFDEQGNLATHVLAPGVDGTKPEVAQDKRNWVKIKHSKFTNKLPDGTKAPAVPKVAGWNVGSDWRVDEAGLGAPEGQSFVVAEDPAWIVNAPATPKFMKGRGKGAVPRWVEGGKSAGGMWPTSQTKAIVKAIADNVFEVMGGPKGTTFSHTSERAPENLYNPLTVNDIQMADGFGFLRDKMANSAVAHRFMTEKMRALGEEMGLSPQEVQATWWAAIRAEVGNAKQGQPVIREPSTIAGKQFDVGDPVASGSWFEAAGQNQKTLELYRRATQAPIKGAFKFFNPAKGTWEDRDVDTTQLSYLHKGTTLPPPYNPTGPGSRGDLSGRLEVSRTAFTEAEKTARAEANRFFVTMGDSARGGAQQLEDWGWRPDDPQIAPLREAMIQHDAALAPDGNGLLVTLRDTGEGTVHRSASIVGRALNLPEVRYYHLDPEGTGLAYTFSRQGQSPYAPQEAAALAKASGLPLRMNPDGTALYVVDDGTIPDLAERLERVKQFEGPYGTTYAAERITTGRVPASEYAEPESVQPFRALDRVTGTAPGVGAPGAAAGLDVGTTGAVSAGPGGDLGRALPVPLGGAPIRERSARYGITPGSTRGAPTRDRLDDTLQIGQGLVGAVAGAQEGDEYDEDDQDWQRAARIAGGALGGAIAGVNAPNARRIARAAAAARAFPPARQQALDALAGAPGTDGAALGVRRKEFLPGDVPEGFDPESVLRSNRTARGEAFSKNAVTPRHLVETATPEEAGSVLDFGSGDQAVWTKKLREQGYDVTAHEFGVNRVEGVHDPEALSRQYDTVFAASVLNTQDAPGMMDMTLGQLAGAVKPGGRVLFNYPLQPRYWMDPDGPKDPKDGLGRASPERVLSHIQKFFGDVKQVDGDPERPTWEARDPLPQEPGLLGRAAGAVRRFGEQLAGDERGEAGRLGIVSKGPGETPAPKRGEDQGPLLGLGPLQTPEDLARVRANPPEGGFTGQQQNELFRAATRIAQQEAASWIRAPENTAEGATPAQREAERVRRLARRQEGLQKVDQAQNSQEVADAAADAEDAARKGEMSRSDADAVRGKAAKKFQEQTGGDGPPPPGEIDRQIAASRARRGVAEPPDDATAKARAEAEALSERLKKRGEPPLSGVTTLPSGVREVTQRTPIRFPEQEVTTAPAVPGEPAQVAPRVVQPPQGADARQVLPGFEDLIPQIEELTKIANPEAPPPGIRGTAEKQEVLDPRRTEIGPRDPAEIRFPLEPGERRQVLPGAGPRNTPPGPANPDDAFVKGDVWEQMRARDRAAAQEKAQIQENRTKVVQPPEGREPPEENPSLPNLIGPDSHRLVDEHGNLLSKRQIASGLMGAAASPGGWSGVLREMTDGWSEPMKRLVAGSKGVPLSPAEVEGALASAGQKSGAGPSKWERMSDQQREGYKDLRWSHIFDGLGTAMRLNMVVTPESIARNGMSTIGAVPLRLYEAMVAPTFQRMWAVLPGYDDKSVEASHARETTAMLEGMWKSGAAAAANAAQMLRHGDPDKRLGIAANQLDNPTVDFHQTKLAEKMGIAFRPLTATDAYLKTLNEGMEAYRLSYRQAQNEFDRGLLGTDAHKIRTRMLEIMNTPSKKMLNEIQQAGEYNTYNQKSGRVANILESIKNWDGGGNPAVSGAWRLFTNFAVPFVRISTNVMKYGMERTVPGGLISMGYGMAKGENAQQMGVRTAKMSEGALMMGALMALDANDMVDVAGALPEDDTEREEWELQGKTPYSVRIGDRWFSMAAYPGLAENLVMYGAIGDIRKKMEEKEARGEEAGLGDWWNGTLDAGMQYLGQTGVRPMFGSVVNLLGAMTARGEGQRQYYRDQLVKSGVGQVMPLSGAMRQLGNWTDTTQREAEGVKENIAAIYPWWRENLPAKTNALGQEMASETNNWFLSGVTSSKQASDTVQERKYRGSESAAMDRRIDQAIRAVNAFEDDRRGHPRPTLEQKRLARRYQSRLNPRRKKMDERVAKFEDRREMARLAADANPFEFQIPGRFRREEELVS
jgi:hypothetical protein